LEAEADASLIAVHRNLHIRRYDMRIIKIIVAGLIAGLVMGVALFLTGVIAAFFVFGSEMASAGKFAEWQMDAWYFFWTKLVIGVLFGILFALIYAKLYTSERCGALRGLLYAVTLWLVISLWGISHPLVYGSIDIHNQLFWHIYTLGGFLAYGITLGFICKRLGV